MACTLARALSRCGERATLSVMARRVKRRGDAQSLSESVGSVDTDEGRERTAAVLASRPFPHFEAAPGQPCLLVKLDEDGTRTVGRFVNRIFEPAR